MMRRALLMVVALLTVSVAWTGGAAASSEAGLRGGPPDTFVTDWDGIGTQAFTAARSRRPRVTRSSPMWPSRSTTR